ncbi:MAG: hydantoinase/oxoprolinase family protein [Enterocloster sp.]
MPGEVALDAELARKAIQEKVADVLDVGIYDAASAIHKIMHNQMADQVRLATVKRGYDPRSFSVVASGGAGPIAACSLLKLLNFKEVIVPPTPGVMAALGLLSADIEHEGVWSPLLPRLMKWTCRS